MRIFVTGANGFIGRAFCRTAALHGHEVLGLQREAVAGRDVSFKAAQGSLDAIPWREIECFAPEAALHLAWIVKPGQWPHSPVNRTLIGQSDRLFRGLADRGVRHLAGSGTGIEYAPSSKILNEVRSPLGPENAYARAKMETSIRLRTLAEEHGLNWTWFRIFYCYGEGEHPDRIASSLLRKLLRGERTEIRTPASSKDFIHVNDVTSALLLCLEKGLRGFVNVGRGQGVSILDFARAAAGVAQADSSLIVPADPPEQDPFPITVADSSRLRALGWNPRVSLREGLERLRHALPGTGAAVSRSKGGSGAPQEQANPAAASRPLRIVVTGANGFIGRTFCRIALAKGHQVLGLRRRPDAALLDGCPAITAPLDSPPLEEISAFQPHAALHLAWCAVPGVNYFSEENHELIAQSGALFQRLASCGVPQLAGVGSMMEYAPSGDPLREDFSTMAITVPYSRAKLATLKLLQESAAENHASWTWFRLFNTYGEGEHRDRLTSWVMRRLLNGETAHIRSPETIRDYTHVDDTAAALLHCLENAATGVINVASGTILNVLDLARRIARIVGADESLVVASDSPVVDPMPVAIADVIKLHATGWRPQIALDDGLRRLLASLRP